ncbi:hypothetical protein [Undibacterium hunanense]|nr:hypothetical protein [Undibacterium hunanense]
MSDYTFVAQQCHIKMLELPATILTSTSYHFSYNLGYNLSYYL